MINTLHTDVYNIVYAVHICIHIHICNLHILHMHTCNIVLAGGKGVENKSGKGKRMGGGDF